VRARLGAILLLLVASLSLLAPRISHAQSYDQGILLGAGATGGPHVRVLQSPSGTETASFFAWDQAYGGGAPVAAGDVNGDGIEDIIVGTGGSSGSDVTVRNGANPAAQILYLAPYPGFSGGVFVAAGDIDGNGRDEIIVGAGAGGGPHVKVFDGITGGQIAGFYAYDQTFK